LRVEKSNILGNSKIFLNWSPIEQESSIYQEVKPSIIINQQILGIHDDKKKQLDTKDGAHPVMFVGF
jgi:hypothetical protein